MVAAQVLMRTQAMVNKYRRLLLVEAEVRTRRSPSLSGGRSSLVATVLHVCVGLTGFSSFLLLLQRSSPSSEMVMIDRTFNQEERSNLTQDKRTVLVDPGGWNKTQR